MKQLRNALLVLLVASGVLVACNSGDAKQTAAVEPKLEKGNYLSMKIDGALWTADHEVSGSYHVTEELGPGVLTVNGQKGTGKTQQDFVVNLYNTNGPGTYTVNIADGNRQATHQNVTQFANLTATNYLCGGALQGGQLTVVITKASKAPQELEGTFSGSMQCVEGNKITITEGKFYYHE